MFTIFKACVHRKEVINAPCNSPENADLLSEYSLTNNEWNAEAHVCLFFGKKPSGTPEQQIVLHMSRYCS